MDDNFNDYFEKDAEVEKPAEHVETPQEREDREIAEATIERRHNTVRMVLVTLIVLLALFLLWWVWQRYYHPVEQGQERGYIMQVTIEGSLKKTFEGQMMSQRFVTDTIVYESDFRFTIKEDSVAAKAMRLQGSGHRVVVDYEQYKGHLPWNGNSNIIVTDVALDSAFSLDTTRISQRRPYKNVNSSNSRYKK